MPWEFPILFGGILTFTHFIKTIFYYYIDGKFSYTVFAKSQDIYLKKTNKVNVSKFSSNLFLYGLLLVVGSLLVAFKKDRSKAIVANFELPVLIFEEPEIIPSTKIEKKIAPPKVEEIAIPKKVEIPKVVRVVTETFIEPTEKIEDIPDVSIDELIALDVSDVDAVVAEVYEDVKDDFEEVRAKIEMEEPPLVIIAQVMPEFPGGEKALIKYLYANIKYPIIAKEMGYEGIVAISFIIDVDGKVTSAEILRDIGGGCGTEALRVIQAMPRWSPGNHNNKNVRVSMKLPIVFKLN